MKIFSILLAALGVLLVQAARSDELRPGYLELRQTTAATYNLLFKIPARGEDLRLAVYVNLPEGTQDVEAPRASFSDGAYIERRTIRRDGGLAGQVVTIEGLSATSTDVLVRIENLGGATQTERLSPTNTAFVVQVTPGTGEVAATYLRLGVEHILFGFDHLLFVLALVPGPPVEATIALSIMLVAVEILNARRGKPSVTARLPWLVAFSFGLLHGFGFAGALAEVGLPQHAIPVALLFFNVGVEVGQLIFVAAVLSLIRLLLHAASQLLEPALVQRTFDRLDVTVAYAIGIVAAYWLVERTTAFFA